VSRALLVTLAAGVLAGGVRAPRARAQPPALSALDPATRSRAERFFRAGNEAYRSGQYAVAARAFEEAYALAPVPAIAFTLAQAQRRQYFVDHRRDRAERALALYRIYLAAVPAGGRRAHAVTHIAALEVALARDDAAAAPPPAIPSSTQIMVISATPGASARIDGGAPAPVPAAFEVAPGPHEVSLAAPGHVPRRGRWLAVEARLVVAQVDLEPAPGRLVVASPRDAAVFVDGRKIEGDRIELAPGPHDVAVARAGYRLYRRSVVVAAGREARVPVELELTTRRRVSFHLFESAGGLLAASLVTTGLALSAEDQARALDAASRERNLTPGELAAFDAALHRRDRWRTGSLVLGAAAVAAAVAGGLLRANDRPTVELSPGTSVAPFAGARSMGLAVRGQF